MKHVKVGVGFGLFRLGLPSVDTIVEVAERAEEWGLDSFWLSDHLLAPSPELDVARHASAAGLAHVAHKARPERIFAESAPSAGRR